MPNKQASKRLTFSLSLFLLLDPLGGTLALLTICLRSVPVHSRESSSLVRSTGLNLPTESDILEHRICFGYKFGPENESCQADLPEWLYFDKTTPIFHQERDIHTTFIITKIQEYKYRE